MSPISTMSSMTARANLPFMATLSSREDRDAGIGSHVELSVLRQHVEHDGHRNPPLEPDPVGGGRHIGQQHRRLLGAAGTRRDTGDAASMELPRIAVEPYPGRSAD